MSLKGSLRVIGEIFSSVMYFERIAVRTRHLSRYWYPGASEGLQLKRLLEHGKCRSVSQEYTFYDSQGQDASSRDNLSKREIDIRVFISLLPMSENNRSLSRVLFIDVEMSECYPRCICLIYQIDVRERAMENRMRRNQITPL